MRKYKVMLVDDEVIILQGFKKLFDWDAYGCEIVGEAMDGVSAISMVDRLHPDILILDINLPIISGIDALKVIRQHDENIQCVMVTGYDDFEYCREALRLEVLDYMLKPVNYAELGTIIEKAIKCIEDKSLITNIAKQNDDGEIKIITQIIGWMNEHLQDDISLQLLSDTFHLNSVYISQMFKNKLGINYHAYLNQIRVNRAKELLSTTDLSITEIAQESGYKDYRTFTRAYRNTTGILPSDQRDLTIQGKRSDPSAQSFGQTAK